MSSDEDVAAVDVRHTETGVPDSLADSHGNSYTSVAPAEAVAGRTYLAHADHVVEAKPQTLANSPVAYDKSVDMLGVACVRLLP